MKKDSLINISTRPALHLPALDLYLDPHRGLPHAFVSHAHADHFARHEKILCSTATGHLLRKRFRVGANRIQTLAYHEVLEIAGHEIRLLPAGHIFGSAMLHVTRREDQATLLYTGDYKLRGSLTSEPTELLPADTLIMETTFGRPNFVFPPREKIVADIIHFVKSTLEDGEQPVLLGYSLGKAQEALAILQEANIPVMAHKTVAEMSVACHEAGLPFPPPPVFEGTLPEGFALVAPPNAVRAKQVKGLKKRRVAMLSGWALTPGSQYRYQTDAVFPLSDHADYPELIETVRKVSPKLVLTLHGSTREFARDLRREGFEAWSIYGDDQIELSLEKEEEASPLATSPEGSLGQGQFADLAQTITKVSETPSRLRKISLLADYLRPLDDEVLALSVHFLSGKLLGERKALTLGTAAIRQALLEATQSSLAHYRQISNTTADAARTARILLEQTQLESPENSGPVNLTDFAELFQQLASIPGTLQKSSLLATTFRQLLPAQSEFLVRLLTGDLRAGLKTALLEDAVAEAFSADPKQVRRAHMLEGDLAKTALLAKSGTLDSASLRAHSPLSPMLASPEPDAEAIVQRLGEFPIHLEPKHDGIRAQLHYDGQEASLFSRDLRSLGEEFPEVLEAAKTLPAPCILDGELIAFAAGRQLNFFDLQKRLGRKRHQGDLFFGEAVPVRFVAFDLLSLDEENLLESPYLERRKHLEELSLTEPFHTIEHYQASSLEEVEQQFKHALAAGHEGLIAKEPKSPYSPGRRGKSWLKLKGMMPTLDCVVIAAQQGHGRRAEVLSDYTFAVRDERTGALATIGKAYSGLTDEEIEDLTEHFKKTTLEKKRRVQWVEPTIVLEIAFDSINPSKRHDSGLALRFPCIKAIRRDKGPADIDTLASAQALAGRKP
ncbi:ATP-dependent DNA ligase [Roseibacillus persicicus]|uniref:ATP-dependent DNA ligase n=1 Tax=Roseibacillus persicicus TaxID=454148 RepID=UPI00167462C5|nr:ATP-dependent DNA ligase [Roseibacillus persicicus]